MKKTFIILFCLLFLFTAPAAADEEHGLGHYDIDVTIPSIQSTASSSAYTGHVYAANLPAAYDLRDRGLVTPVKEQGKYGSCWSFSVINALESNAIMQGFETAETADFSELQLLYFYYNRNGVTVGDVLPEFAGLSGDNVEILTGESYLDAGGNIIFAGRHLSKGMGVIDEEYAPYSLTNSLDWDNTTVPPVLDARLAVDKNRYLVSNVTLLTPSDRDLVKEHLMKYGCGAICYYDTDEYFNTAEYQGQQSTSYFQNVQESTNHAVSLVGWDDNYPKENFLIQPKNNGAWLIKNSWGEDFGDGGYFWLSYEDTSTSVVVFYELRPSAEYDSIYQYDGSLSNGGIYSIEPIIEDGMTVASSMNVYTASGDELITHVSFETFNTHVSYAVLVTNGTEDFMYVQEGELLSPGYYTVELTTPVSVREGETFAVAVAFAVPDTSANIIDGTSTLMLPVDQNDSDGGLFFTSVSRPEESWWFDGSNYFDAYDLQSDVIGQYNFRIKAFAVNVASEDAESGIDTAWYTQNPDASTFSISTQEELFGLAKLVNSGTESFTGKTIFLVSDIDLCGENWLPIGNSTFPFSGTFDGGYHTISNLSINQPNLWYTGLFGYADDTIQNLVIDALDISGSGSVGTVAGRAEIGRNLSVSVNSVSAFDSGGFGTGGAFGEVSSLANVSVHANSVSGSTSVGGVAGSLSGWDVENADITVSIGSVTGTGSRIGGAFGSSSAEWSHLSNVTVIVDSVAGSVFVGGVIGDAQSLNLANVWVSADTIYASERAAGGVAGLSANVDHALVQVQNISVRDRVVGGIAGLGYGDITNSAVSVEIISAGTSEVGGAAGVLGGNCTNVFIHADSVSGHSVTGGIAGYVSPYMGEVVAISHSLSAVQFISGTTAVGGIAGGLENPYDPVEMTYHIGLDNVLSLSQYVNGTAGVGRIIGSINATRNWEVSDSSFILGDPSNGLEFDAANIYAWGSMMNSSYPFIDDEILNGISVSSLQFWNNQSFFEDTLGWDFEHIWKMNSGNDKYQLPVLQFQTTPVSGDASYLLGESAEPTPTPTPTPEKPAAPTLTPPVSLPADAEETTNTVSETNAATKAEVGYQVKPSDVTTLTAPTITRGKLSVQLNEGVKVVKTLADGTEEEVEATVNEDGSLTVPAGSLDDAAAVTVNFIGRQFGDVTNDGKPDTLDAARVLQASVGLFDFSGADTFYGDVSGDGYANTLDAARILQYSVSLVDENYVTKA